MVRPIRNLFLALATATAFAAAMPANAESSLLNVSYDVSRDFYKDYNLSLIHI